MLSLGERLRMFRKARRITQQQAAERIGCDQTRLSRWELGKRPIPAGYRDRVEGFIEGRQE